MLRIGKTRTRAVLFHGSPEVSTTSVGVAFNFLFEHFEQSQTIAVESLHTIDEIAVHLWAGSTALHNRYKAVTKAVTQQMMKHSTAVTQHSGR